MSVRALGLLTVESFRDTLRRRVVIVVAVLLLLVLSGLESCVGEGTITINERELDPAPFVAPALFTLLASGAVALAAILGADHLARPLGDGTATLWLARPVGRVTYALSRLAGAVGVAWVTAFALLGTTAFLNATRSDLPTTPALVGACACALGIVVFGALSMLASLWLPRIAAVLVMLVAVPWLVAIDAIAFAGVEYEGMSWAIHTYGPGIFTAILDGVIVWTPGVEAPENAGRAWGQLGFWAGLSVALLLLAFRRLELETGGEG